MRNVFDHTEIMGNKQIGNAKLFLQRLEEVDNLGLNGDVEC